MYFTVLHDKRLSPLGDHKQSISLLRDFIIEIKSFPWLRRPCMIWSQAPHHPTSLIFLSLICRIYTGSLDHMSFLSQGSSVLHFLCLKYSPLDIWVAYLFHSRWSLERPPCLKYQSWRYSITSLSILTLLFILGIYQYLELHFFFPVLLSVSFTGM